MKANEFMMKEAYCSYEISKHLKEKGFDIPCLRVYDNNGIICIRYTDFDKPHNYIDCSYYYLCPTHQMAMAWLREKGFHIVTNISFDTSEDADGNIVDKWTFWFFEILSSFGGNLIYTEEIDEYDSNEQAVESAIKYVLKNLI